MTSESSPLGDLRVIDLTVARAGPTAVRVLADWGADVVRVEPPAGTGSADSARHSSDFQNLHRNKRSIVIDLKSDAGRGVLFDLVEKADVLVENWRPQVKSRLGIGPDVLCRLNPALIYASISGFGQDGPGAERGGVDQIAQGQAGLMSVTGEPGRDPLRVGVPISDLAAGIHLATGILAALHERARSGKGQWIRTSLIEAMVAMLDFQATRWTIDGETPGPAGNNHPTLVPMGTFITADGHVNIAGPSGRLWRGFCEAIDRQDLLTDERYSTQEQRSINRDDLHDAISAETVKRDTADWILRFERHGVPCGPIQSIPEAFADPQIAHLDLTRPVVHNELGELRLIRNPVTMTRSTSDLHTATPELGQDTDQLLSELGYGQSTIEELRSTGAVT